MSVDYWQNICELQKKQRDKGVKKYGQTLEDNTYMNIEERLEYLQEELIDGLMYIEHIKQKATQIQYMCKLADGAFDAIYNDDTGE